VSEAADFGRIVLIAAVGFAAAILSSRISERLRLPAPAPFLAVAAVASDLLPRLGDVLSVRDVERIGVVALIVILFDGGIEIGWPRARQSLMPIVALGVVGTFAVAGLVAIAMHGLFGLSWTSALLVGAALAPTDPAVMFSVLGGREVAGRSGVILQGESGANDPVGIALMLGLLEVATSDGTWATIVVSFVVAMAVGLAVGVLGGLLLARLIRRHALPDAALYPLQTLAAAGIIYGLASVLHGSGFLAVFVAGLLIAEVRAPFKVEIVQFHTALASLAEIVVFVALGLTVQLSSLDRHSVVIDGILIALLLTFVIRPAVVIALLAPVRLARGEKLFVAWAGLRGAVPILLAAFALLEGAPDARRIYGLVFVVVMFSVVVQGTLVQTVARLTGVPMERVAQDPWK
jgi:cell volume regulation protein A